MKQIIFIFMSLLCFSCSSKAQNQTADTNVQSDKKILVAYFSCTGTTEKSRRCHCKNGWRQTLSDNSRYSLYLGRSRLEQQE